MEGVVASVTANDAAKDAGIDVDSSAKTSPKITFTAGTVKSGETKLVSGGAVAAVTDALSGRIAQLEGIAHFSVEIVPEGQTIESVTPLVENTIYLVKEANTAEGTYIEYIAYKPKDSETVVTEKIGSTAIDLSCYTTYVEHTALSERVTALDAATTGRVAVVESEISTLKTTTIPAAITTAQGYTDTTLSNALKDGGSIATAINAAKEAAIANAKVTLTAGTGITIPNSGKQDTAFTVSVDTDVIATKQSVDDLSGLVTALSETVGSNKTEVDGKISAIEGKLASTGEIGQAIADVKATADSAVQSVTVNGTEAKSGTTVSITALTAVDSSKVGSNGITIGETDKKVTLSVTPATYTSSTKTWTNDTNFAKASDIATAISDAVGAIVIPPVQFSGSAQNVGFSIDESGDDEQHYLHLATAEYTASTDTWTNKGYLVTGATVEAFVSDVVSEVSSDLTALEQKVDNFHKAGVSYQVLSELPKLEDLEDKGLQYNGVIVLIPEPLEGDPEPTTPEAIAGSYTEYLCVKSGDSYKWEQIGTTKVDLRNYVQDIKVNNTHHTEHLEVGYVNLGSFAETVATGQATTLANQGSVYANIATDGTLTLGVASATDSVMGVSKMFTGNLSTAASTVTDTAVSVKSAQSMYSSLATLANSKVSSVQDGAYLNLAGLAVNTGSYNDVTEGIVKTARITSRNITSIDDTSVIDSGNVRGVKDCTLVESNSLGYRIDTSIFAFGEDVYCNNFFSSNTKSRIEYWSGDMPNLVGGGYMFDGCTALTSFCGDLSSLKDGGYMFRGCTALTSFCGDLSSLKEGGHMFGICKLDAESLECIADTLPTVSDHPIIDIGYGSLATAAAAQAAQSAIQAKGWTCTMTYNA